MLPTENVGRTMADKSICPGAAAGLAIRLPPAGAPPPGREADGIGGLAAILGGPRPVLGAIGGGFGLVATGGP